MAIDIIALIGPTASGKTGKAVALARRLRTEIISGDSRQVYTGMTIGTGKDLCEYGNVPYHLIDIRPAGHKYNLHEYIRDFHTAYDSIRERRLLPILCGGSGMYIENALNGIVLPQVGENRSLRQSLAGKTLGELTGILAGMKALHNTTDVDTPARAIRAIEIARYYELNPEAARLADKSTAKPLDSVVIGIDIPRDARRERITQRLHSRLDEGMVDEVRGLLDGGLKPDDLLYYGLEYKYVTMYLTGVLDYDSMVRELETAIHQFAKRQMTWFRGMERRGHKIHWLPFDLSESDFTNAVLSIIRQRESGINDSPA